MLLSKKTATNLIKEISSVIDYDINIMDETGAIIASTDKERIGSFHEAAWQIIDGNLPELLVHSDGEYKGCLKGTNLPLVADDEIIGVIGITGNVEETMRYGNLIKRVTEILMKDIISLQQETKKIQSRLFFVSEWLNKEISDVSEIKRRIHKYAFKPTGTWQVAILKNITDKNSTRNFLSYRMDPTLALTAWNNEYGIAIGNFSSSKKFASYIASLFNEEFLSSDFFCTLGNTVLSKSEVPQSFDQALSTFHLTTKPTAGIFHYNEMLMDIALESIPEKQRSNFVNETFSSVPVKEIPDIVNFIKLYQHHNGSINAIANAMFIHKNTVQYRINKIISLCNLDLRNLTDLEKLLLAARWWQ